MSLVQNGISNCADRELNDFYATDPKAVDQLLELEQFNKSILECCAGMGHIAEVLKKYDYNVITNDLYDRGYPLDYRKDLLSWDFNFEGDIITNPPYKNVSKYINKMLNMINEGNKIACFLKLTFLETLDRYEHIFKLNPPKVIYISTKRSICAKGGRFDKYKSNAIAYAWFIWEKGFRGEPTVRWFNNK